MLGMAHCLSSDMPLPSLKTDFAQPIPETYLNDVLVDMSRNKFWNVIWNCVFKTVDIYILASLIHAQGVMQYCIIQFNDINELHIRYRWRHAKRDITPLLKH